MFLIICKLIILSTGWCVAIYMMSDPGDIFYFLRRWTHKAPPFIFKPIIGCVNCMASLHTAIVWALYSLLQDIRLIWWQYGLIYLIAAVITVGTNGLVWTLYMLMKDHEEDEEEDVSID